MRKLVFLFSLLILLIGLPREAFAADALYRMLHAGEVESFQENQDALIVGQIMGEENQNFQVKVLKILSGKVITNLIHVEKNFTYGWDKMSPAVNDFAVFSLKQRGLAYKKAWGIFKADSGDYRTLGLDIRNAPSPGLLGDLACIEWYVNSGGRDNDFSFQGNGNGVNVYVQLANGESFQIYPDREKEPSTVEPSIAEPTQGTSSSHLQEGLLTPLLVPLIGWPGIIASISFSLLGLTLRKPLWILVGAFFAFPISLYLSATPRFQYILAGLPLLQMAAAYALHKRRKSWIPWLLHLPLAVIVVWLGLGVL